MPKKSNAPALPILLLSEVLSRRLKPGKGSPKLPAGEYPLKGTVTVALDCVLSKLADTDARASYTPDLARVLAYTLNALGAAAEGVGGVIEAAIAFDSASDSGKVPQAYLDLSSAAVERASRLIADGLPRQEKAGATSVRGTVEIDKFKPIS